MKLLSVVPSYWPAFQYGGPVASLRALNKGMASEGVLVTVYTTNAGLDGQVSVNTETDVDGIPVIYFSFNRQLEILGATGWQFSRRMTSFLDRNVREFDIAYIVSIWNYPSLIAARYCRKYGKPYVVSPRGLLYPDTFSKKIWKKWPYYHLAAKSVLQNAAAIHYTTEDEAEKTHAYLGLENRAVVIPNGIDLSEFRNLPNKTKLNERYPYLAGKKVILFLGRISWKKGLDILVRAYGKLCRERDDLHLLVVGHDDEGFGVKVKSWLRDLGIGYIDNKGNNRGEAANAKVTFTGMLIGEEKLAAFAGSDLFVLPSYSENFAMTVLEAAACGIPVVISNKVGLSSEIKRARAGLVVEADSASLRAAIVSLLERAELREQMIRNGKRLVEDYQSTQVARRMVSELESLVVGHHGFAKSQGSML